MPSISYTEGQPKDQNHHKFQNYISTTYYRLYNFLPLSVWNQVKSFTTMYFILQAIISFVPQVSTISPLSAVGPVVFVIVFSLCFDLTEDFLRYLKDRKTNMTKAIVLRGQVWERVEYQHVKEGDIIKIYNDGQICADIIVLSFKSISAYAYIETSNLDGEKNLKPKMSVFEKFLDGEDLLIKYPAFEVNFQPNVEFLERFDGHLTAYGKESKVIESHLNIANFMPRSCQVKNTLEVIGLVVYTGKDTKIMRNTKTRRIKMSKVEKRMNVYILYLILLLFLLLCFLATYSILKRKYHDDFILYYLPQEYTYGVYWVFTLLTYFLTMNTIVPISLIITLQLAKTVMSAFYLLEKKTEKIEVQINTLNIHEELGQIEYILTDKTGTLTQNKMILKYFQVRNKTVKIMDQKQTINETVFTTFKLESSDGNETYNVDTVQELDRLYFLTLNSCHECFAESKNEKKEEPSDADSSFINQAQLKTKLGDSSTPDDFGSISQKSKDVQLQDFETAIKVNEQETDLVERATNHSNFRTQFKKFPKNPEASKFMLLQENIEIQGPSPDEIAILRASKNFCGFLFKGSTINEAIVMDEKGNDIVVNLKMVNKFDSIRKMMTVVGEVDGRIFVMAKGADSKIISRLKKTKSQFEEINEKEIQKKADEFVNEGLRILYVAVRLLSTAEWTYFAEKIRAANQGGNYEEQMNSIGDELETEMTLIGATAIEDKLQDNLSFTVEQIRKANIKLWMITGDKLETAENIAYSSGIFKRDRTLVIFRNIDDFDKIDSMQNQNLIIDGEFFGDLLHKKNEDLDKFKSLIMDFPNVVFSRTNANQKVEVVKIVKSFKKMTLAVGDGANDVNMIQEAHVGIGIYGEEGIQASNAADFSIKKFELISELLFNHGRLSYNRVCDLIMFFFYKNFMFTIPQLIYGFFCDFSGTTVFVDYYITFFNLLFTAFVASARSVYNKDIYGYTPQNGRTLEIYTYYYGQQNLGLNAKNFLLWLLGGIVEVCLVFFFVFGAYRYNGYELNHESTYEFMTMLVISIIIFHQTNKICYLTNIFLLIQALLYSTGYWFFILYFVITNYYQSGGMYRVNSEIWGVGGYWLSFTFMLYVLLLLTFLYVKIQETFFPNVFNLIMHGIDRDSEKDCEEQIKELVEMEKLNVGLIAWFFN